MIDTGSRHMHFLGICGYTVSGAALLAKAMGHTVTGSDDGCYPPTTDILTAAGVPWVDGSDPANLTRWGMPDVVVVGNDTRPHNTEWLEVRRLGLPMLSEIEFYSELARHRTRIAVCGTHGKTTTTALVAHMLEQCGMEPGLRLGSISLDLGTAARLGRGPFVFEGDEYTSAPWDRRPKFLHMRPLVACVTRLELDHPDVYPTLEAYRAGFLKLAGTMPRDGTLALCADDPEALALAREASCRVVTYGEATNADWRISDTRESNGQQHFQLNGDGADLEVSLTFPGRHNAANATAALLLATAVGAPLRDCIAACASFRGPARRFEILGEAAGVEVVDDYAHHPTECSAAIAAARQRYAGRRLLVIHTPHTYSRTKTLLEDYRQSFGDADEVVIGPIEAARERDQVPSVTSADVASRAGDPDHVHVVADADAGLALLTSMARPGDVMLILSLGGFDKFAPRLLTALGGVPA